VREAEPEAESLGSDKELRRLGTATFSRRSSNKLAGLKPEAESLGSNKELRRLGTATFSRRFPNTSDGAEPEAESLGSDNAMVIYHFVFRTYKGKSVLVDKVALRFLNNSFREIATSKGFRIIKCHILSDHVHLLMEFNKRHRIDYAIRMIKGISSRRFFKFFNTNRYKYRKLWGRSYFAEMIDQGNIGTISRYIEQQSINGFDKRFN